MTMCLRAAVVLVCVLVLSGVAFAQAPRPQQQAALQQSETCQTALPANVEAGLLTSEMIALLRRSDTFRAQCERIAAQPRVRVRLRIVNSVDGSGRAQTTMRVYRAGALQADVELLFGEDYRELLGHELEHVIEQIDGVDLRDEAAAGRAWQVDGGVYETRRAFSVGVQVVRECTTALSPALQPLR
jgi:hypothetical protein